MHFMLLFARWLVRIGREWLQPFYHSDHCPGAGRVRGIIESHSRDILQQKTLNFSVAS